MGFQDVLFQSLEEHGWAVCDRIVPPSLTHSLRNHAHQHWQQGLFKPAAMGRQVTANQNPDIRGDAICWLERSDPAPASVQFLSFAEALSQDLNQHFYMGLRSHEFHFARYEPGRGYARHMDQHHDTQARKVSIVLYLNEDWQPHEGGELCLYNLADNNALPEARRPVEPVAKIAPVGGRLVMFCSDQIPHEVLAAHRVRWSLTGWFRNDTSL